MGQQNKRRNSTDSQMGWDLALLVPVSRNYLKRGDKVRMKDGRILTVKSLELKEFVSEEEIGHIPKKDIEVVLEYKSIELVRNVGGGT